MNFIKKLFKSKKAIDEMAEHRNFNIFNRPNEGEIVKIENIKIKKYYKMPNSEKLKQKEKYYKRHNYFRSTIVLDNNNVLIDGYITYLLTKKFNYEFITIVRN